MEQTEFQYEVTFKREASKGIDGFTVTARGANEGVTMRHAISLRKDAIKEVSEEVKSATN
jgi:hypothetical protein